LILRNERLLATVSSHLNGESPNPAALSITITQSSLLGVFAQSSLLGHEHKWPPDQSVVETSKWPPDPGVVETSKSVEEKTYVEIKTFPASIIHKQR
jgi:hypothetical protein